MPEVEKNSELPAPPGVKPPLPSGVEEAFVEIAGARVRFLRAGQGPPLLLLHGLMGYSFSWRLNLAALGQVRTVYALDQLGAGFSDRPPDLDCTMPSVARRVLDFADQLGIGSFDLLGTSHGGAVAITLAGMLADRNSSRIRRLILVAPANPWSRHGRHLAPILNQPPFSTAFLWTVPQLPVFHSLMLRRLYGDHSRIPEGTLQGYAAALLRPGSFEYGLGVLRSWLADLENLKSILPKLRDLPILLMWGSEDAAVNPDSAGMIRKELPASRFALLRGVGHLPYEEAPEEFNRLVADFLAGNDSV